MAAVAQLKALVGLDTGPYKAGQRDINRANRQIKRSFAQIGRAIGISFSVGAIVQAGRGIMRYAGEVSLAARSTGMLTSEVMALNQVALQTGMGMRELQRLSSRLSSELFNAANGSDQAREKFERLGFEISDLAAKDPAQMLEEVARAAFDSGIPLQELTNLFGERLGPQAVNALREISENGLPEVDRAIGETADRLEVLGSRWSRVFDEIRQVSLGVLSVVGEGWQRMTDFIGGRIANEIERVQRAFALLRDLRDGFMERDEEGRRGGIRGAFREAREGIEERRDDVRATGWQTMMDGIEQREREIADMREGRDRDREESRKQMVQMALDDEERRRMEIVEKEAQERERKQERLMRDLERERQQEQRQAERLRTQMDRDIERAQGMGIEADALARIGGFMGGERAGLAIEDQQLRVQEIMSDYLRQINDSMATMAAIEQRMEGGGI